MPPGMGGDGEGVTMELGEDGQVDFDGMLKKQFQEQRLDDEVNAHKIRKAMLGKYLRCQVCRLGMWKMQDQVAKIDNVQFLAKNKDLEGHLLDIIKNICGSESRLAPFANPFSDHKIV